MVGEGLLLYLPCGTRSDEDKEGLSSHELNRQRNNRINGCNCRGIAVMFV
jgi:hypothetical protein